MVLEATAEAGEAAVWREYEFKCKPGAEILPSLIDNIIYSRWRVARPGDEGTLHHLTVPLPPGLAHVVCSFPELPTG